MNLAVADSYSLLEAGIVDDLFHDFDDVIHIVMSFLMLVNLLLISLLLYILMLRSTYEFLNRVSEALNAAWVR